MTKAWDERVDAFWRDADDERPEAMLSQMKALVDERGADSPEALYEWASVHDFLGHEADAIPLYRAALEHGLTGERQAQALVQLASSLRNVGDAAAAVALLQDFPEDAVTGAAPQAFLALALRDAGRPDEALRVALRALAPTLPMYRRAVEAYADALVEPDAPR